MRIITAQSDEKNIKNEEKENIQSRKSEIIKELKLAYLSEIETAMNYLSASVNMKGIKEELVADILSEDVDGEMNHAKILAERLHFLGEIIPSSEEFDPKQPFLSSSLHKNLLDVIKGVIKAEQGAIDRYRKIANLCDEEKDWSTQELIVGILQDEEGHLVEFVDFLKEFGSKN